MRSVFPGVDSPEFLEAVGSLSGRVDALRDSFDKHGVGEIKSRPNAAEVKGTFEAITDEFNGCYDEAQTIFAYLGCLVAVDSRHDAAQQKLSELQTRMVDFWKLETRLNAWIGCLPIEELIELSDVARNHSFALKKAQVLASHQMTPNEEDLAADLAPSGSQAWGKLHGNFTSRLSVTFQGESLPMSAVRNLAYSDDRTVRREAYEAELDAWSRNEFVIASALNGVKGQAIALNRRRGWKSPLEEAIFRANIDLETLEAMMAASREAFPAFRRYLGAKARALGIPKLAWYDIFAPLGSESKVWDYEEGKKLVLRTFATYSDKMADFAIRAFREEWIDAEPRDGKRDGAFCSGIRKDESRIMMNFKPSFGAVSTLAHELGHGYHNLCLNGRTKMQRATPMTLAETASIFCETITRQAALEECGPGDRIAILEASLQGACQVVVDITSRFEFEKAVFGRRVERELSSTEFCEIMREAQLNTYGDGLDSEQLHPYMWAAKPHYYGFSFYNFPYMFGLLFGLGLYARYLESPDDFKGRYDDLLSSTGMGSAAELAEGFGIDVRSPEFWRSSLAVIESDVNAFVEAVA